MTDLPSARERRFTSAAPHYLDGRPPYAAALIADLVRYCGLAPTHRVMDLGCGPGMLAVALAPFAREVVALDPEPEMLRIAADYAARAGAAVRFIEADSEALDRALGSFRLVTMGRSFHWMDRARTLMRLDGLIEREGAVALLHDAHPEVPDNAWRQPFRALLRGYAGDDPTHPRRRDTGWVRHEAVLLDSPFGRLTRLTAIERRRTPVERFVDRALSMSSTAPARLGARADALAREIEALMAPHAVDGLVTEVVESEALIARRPAPA